MQLQVDSKMELSAEHEPLSSPHFDDERTLLSARPVIPLADIETKWFRKRHFPVGFALVLIILTAGSLIMVQTLRIYAPTVSKQNSFEAVPDENADQSAAGNSPIASTNNTQPTVQPNGGTLPETNPPFRSAANISRHSKTTTSMSSSRKLNEVDPPAESDDSDDNVDPSDLRELRREERRADRQARRAARNRGNREDGVFKIKDIFEGAGRP